ncbi:efflux transporter outer membrane subunit [Edaphobacter modestus]|uniref:NodT family efflux transporter outer membrane factor (OMF) lipoprotein n=1 Tax=Edaphobacter modestus TaxID=388466 RepID=A0A4Q7Z030_9BACT|nr:efflux transporter outer membrane subunit [Edaphobacter modestus]RZU43438.1 NodT family efflux transporter outer membrane factor (OMF) lipoprotein [Edaphobacter modestus]
MNRVFRSASMGVAALISVTLAGCRVGPQYVRPAAPVAPEFKETLPSNFKSSDGWKVAQPSDAQLKGDWWTLFHDSELNTLEAQIDPANQTLKQAEANFRSARASVRFYRANKAPTIGADPSIGVVRDSTNQPYFNKTLTSNGSGDFTLPIDLNYEVDLWGRIRRSITQSQEQAQASAADLETTRLSLHAELAIDYFDLRSADAQRKLLDETVSAFQDALQLTEDRYNGGAAPLSDVTQARTVLQTAQVQATDVDIMRADYEHAIAMLVGKPPAQLTLPRNPVTVAGPTLPEIPGALPSQLLERRPDIAADERRMAAANEQIGIAEAAFYPTLSLSAVAGFTGTSALTWFTWPSRFFAVGPTLSQTLYDHGRRRATSDITRAGYDFTVASYRQTTLTAFQQVEDDLNALHGLETEAGQQQDATASAQQSLDLFTTRYEGGVDTYLQVITWQTALLQNERNDIDITQRRLEASVLLIKALGGGWNASQLPQHP